MDIMKKVEWIRCFTVTVPAVQKKHYTLYMVTSMLYPKQSPEAKTEVVVLKRYSEFRKLYKTLKSLHSALHLTGEFPVFAQTKIFNRFDQDVIHERRESALRLLNFVAQHQALFTNQAFVSFFEGCQQGGASDQPAPQRKSSAVYFPSKYTSAKSDDTVDATRQSDLDSMSSWSLSQETETGSSSLNGSSLSINKEHSTKTTAADIHSTNQCSLFESNEELFGFTFPKAFADFEGDCFLVAGDGLKAETVQRLSNSLESLLKVELDDCAYPVLQPMSPFVTVSNFDFAGSYLITAGQQVSDAQMKEANGLWDGAYNAYKTAISTLLIGVQNDRNSDRIQAVRRKTAQYLTRAELLYNNYLFSAANKDRDVISLSSEQPPPDIGRVNNWELLRRSSAELSRYRVLGVLSSNTQLVFDIELETTFVIKVLTKSLCSPSTRTVVPVDLPFMVNIRCYYDTEDAIIIVLDHASGGKLWDYIAGYTGGNDRASTPALQMPTGANVINNVYSGLKLDCDSGLTGNVGGCVDCSPSYAKLCHSYRHRTNSGKSRNSFAVDTLSEDDVINDFHSSEFGCVNSTDLIANAKRLMSNVDCTLERCERAIVATAGGDSCPESSLHDCHRDSFSSKRRLADNGKLANAILISTPKTPRRSTVSFGSAGPGSTVRLRRHSSVDSLDLKEHKHTYICENHSNNIVNDTKAMLEQLELKNRRKSNSSGGSTSTSLPEAIVRKWAAEIVLAVDALHRAGLICGDLSPHNILLGEESRILLTYQSRWEQVESAVDPIASAGMYVAPEVNALFSPTDASDWWSVGVLLFEILTGDSLSSCHPAGFTAHTTLYIPDSRLSVEAKSILSEFLRYDPTERLGCSINGIEDIQSHPFFQAIDWRHLIKFGSR